MVTTYAIGVCWHAPSRGTDSQACKLAKQYLQRGINLARPVIGNSQPAGDKPHRTWPTLVPSSRYRGVKV